MKDGNYPAGSLLDVTDAHGKKLTDEGICVAYDKEAETKEIKTKVEIKQMSEVKVENKEVNIKIAKKDSFADGIKALVSGEINQITLKAPTGQDETDASDGLNLVYQGMDTLRGALMMGSVIYPKCQKITSFGPNEYGRFIPYRDESTLNATSALRPYQPGEGVAKTPSKMAFGKHDLKLGVDAVVTYLTEEILQDVSYLEQYVVNNMKGRLGWTLDNHILNATYAAGTVGYIGIFDGGAANFYTEPVAHNATYTGTIINKIVSGIDPRLRKGAEWYMSNSVWATLMGTLGVGTTVSTQPIFNADGTVLAGYPVNVMTQMSAFGSAGDILLANMGEAYTVAQKGDIIISRSTDVAFLTDEIVLRATVRSMGAPTYRKYAAADGVTVCGLSSTSGT